MKRTIDVYLGDAARHVGTLRFNVQGAHQRNCQSAPGYCSRSRFATLNVHRETISIALGLLVKALGDRTLACARKRDLLFNSRFLIIDLRMAHRNGMLR